MWAIILFKCFPSKGKQKTASHTTLSSFCIRHLIGSTHSAHRIIARIHPSILARHTRRSNTQLHSRTTNWKKALVCQLHFVLVFKRNKNVVVFFMVIPYFVFHNRIVFLCYIVQWITESWICIILQINLWWITNCNSPLGGAGWANLLFTTVTWHSRPFKLCCLLTCKI